MCILWQWPLCDDHGSYVQIMSLCKGYLLLVCVTLATYQNMIGSVALMCLAVGASMPALHVALLQPHRAIDSAYFSHS